VALSGGTMSRVNWTRFAIGGLIASVIAFVTDGLLHHLLLHHHWEALVSALGIAPRPESSTALLYFALFELGRGFVSMYLYTMMRARLGPGPRTAAWAGVIGWIAFSLTGPAQFIPLGFFSHALWLRAGAYQFGTSVLATVAGAAVYSEKT
jgi:hypothetical protein